MIQENSRDIQHFDPKHVELIDEGLHGYAGTTGTGKTFKALHDLSLLHNTTGDRGAIIIDTVGSPTLGSVERVPTLRDAIQGAWGEGKLLRWHPSTEGGKNKDKDFESLMRASLEGGNIRLLIDEIGFWVRQKQMVELARVWRNANVTMLMTAQHLSGDFGQVLLACNPTIYSFRLTAPAGIEFAEEWLDITPEENKLLDMGDYYERKF